MVDETVDVGYGVSLVVCVIGGLSSFGGSLCSILVTLDRNVASVESWC